MDEFSCTVAAASGQHAAYIIKAKDLERMNKVGGPDNTVTAQVKAA
jgi:hypothetical protein